MSHFVVVGYGFVYKDQIYMCMYVCLYHSPSMRVRIRGLAQQGSIKDPASSEPWADVFIASTLTSRAWV